MPHRRPPHRRPLPLRAAPLLLALAPLAGCRSDEPVSVAPPPGVTVAPATLSLVVGDSALVGAVESEDGRGPARFQWTSTTPDVVRVDSAVLGGGWVIVRAVGAGTAVLSVVVSRGEGGAVAAVPVTVERAPSSLP